MSILTQAIYTRLATDPTLVANLATYKGGPAIFTVETVPEEADMPYIITAGDIGQSAFDTKTSRGRDIVRDVRCYCEASGSSVKIELIAERVRELLHRYRIANALFTQASGPSVLPTDETVYGRLITLRWVGTLQ